MTEFWVSQGNKWCDFCKIYISNNSTSIRTHELGTRHKDSVAKKLAGIKKDNAVKEKETLLALKDLEKIEALAKKSYERDLAAMRRLDTVAKAPEIGKEGVHSETAGASRTYFSEPATDARKNGSVIRAQESLPAVQRASKGEPANQKIATSAARQTPGGQASQIHRDETKSSTYAAQNASSASRFGRSGKGMVASSLQVSKKRRVEKPVSSEETAALAARESARKRMKEREESLLGLYHHSF